MKIVKATIILSDAADLVTLYTDLPSSMPNVTSQNLMMTFHVAKNGAWQYLKKNFIDVPVEILSNNYERK